VLLLTGQLNIWVLDGCKMGLSESSFVKLSKAQSRLFFLPADISFFCWQLVKKKKSSKM
jgi:hypothetical protein